MTKEQIKTALDNGVSDVTLTSGLVLGLTTKLDLIPENRRPTSIPDGAGSTIVAWNAKTNQWASIKAENVDSIA